MFNVLLSLLMLMKFATSVTAFFFVLDPSLFMREYMTWSRVQHNRLLKKTGFFLAGISRMVWEGAQVIPVRGKGLGRSGYLQWSNTWCMAGVTDGSLTSACDHFGGARTSKQEQDPSVKVRQE